MRLREVGPYLQEGSVGAIEDRNSGRKVQEGAPMNQNTLFRLRRRIVLGLAVVTAIVTTSAAAATGPPGATAEPVAVPTGPPGATAEPVAAPTGPPGATAEPVAAPTGPPGATAEPVAPSTVQPGDVQVVPVPSSPVVEVRGGLDWADAGIGAGIAFGGILLLGGALLVVRRSGQRHRLATH
jgi:hypothetical protein